MVRPYVSNPGSGLILAWYGVQNISVPISGRKNRTWQLDQSIETSSRVDRRVIGKGVGYIGVCSNMTLGLWTTTRVVSSSWQRTFLVELILGCSSPVPGGDLTGHRIAAVTSIPTALQVDFVGR